MAVILIIALMLIVLTAVFLCLSSILNGLGDQKYRWAMSATYAIFTTGYHLILWNKYNDGMYSVVLAVPPIFLGMPGSFIGMACSTPFSKLAVSAVTGTLQWFCIGWAVDTISAKLRRSEKSRSESGPLSW